MRLTSTIALTIAIGMAAATSAVAADACKLLKQGTTSFCGTFVYSSTAKSEQDSVTFGPHRSLSISGKGFTGSGSFSCPGRGFIEVHYVLSFGAKNTWYGTAPNGVVSGTGYGKGVFETQSNIYKWTLTPGACH